MLICQKPNKNWLLHQLSSPSAQGKHRYGWEMIFNDRSLPILLLWRLICYITVGCLMPMSNKWIERNVFHLSDSNYIVMSSCIFVSYSYVFIYLHAFLLTTLFLTLADCTDSETNVFASHLVLALQNMLFIHWKNQFYCFITITNVHIEYIYNSIPRKAMPSVLLQVFL